jgi:hypothetical protein
MIKYVLQYLEQNIMLNNDSLIISPQLHSSLLLLWASTSYSEFPKEEKNKVVDILFLILGSCKKMLEPVAKQQELLEEKYLKVAEVLLIVYKIVTSVSEYPSIRKANVPVIQEVTVFLMSLQVPFVDELGLEDNKVKLYTEFDIGHWISTNFDRKSHELHLWWRLKNNIVKFLSVWGG